MVALLPTRVMSLLIMTCSAYTPEQTTIVSPGALAPIETTTSPSNDTRSYHISSEKIARELGWKPKRTIEDAVVDLCRAFRAGKLPNPLTDIRYYNVKAVQAARLA